jgi:hypothetical protein
LKFALHSDGIITVEQRNRAAPFQQQHEDPPGQAKMKKPLPQQVVSETEILAPLLKYQWDAPGSGHLHIRILGRQKNHRRVLHTIKMSMSSSGYSDFQLGHSATEVCVESFRNILSSYHRRLQLELYCVIPNEYLQTVLEVANKRQLVESFHIQGQESSLKTIIPWVVRYMSLNKNLNTLVLSGGYGHMSLSEEAVLLRDALQSTKLLETLTIREESSQWLTHMLEGIKGNMSLRKLSIVVRSNQGIPNIVESLRDHETIRELHLIGRCSGVGADAILPLLSSRHCKLTVLELRTFDLPTQQVDALLATLWDGHPLEELNINGNQMETLKMPRFLAINSGASHLRILRIRGNALENNWRLNIDIPKCQEHCRNLLDILKAKPGLFVDCSDTEKLVSQASTTIGPQLMALLDYNRIGSSLLQGYDVPFVLWPYVFERASRILEYHDSRQATVIYQLLRDRGVFFLTNQAGNNGREQLLTADRGDTHARLSNLVVVRMLSKGGSPFEIVCYRKKLSDYGKALVRKVSAVLETRKIFTIVSKGEYAHANLLRTTFGTKDELRIAEVILSRGRIQR